MKMYNLPIVESVRMPMAIAVRNEIERAAEAGYSEKCIDDLRNVLTFLEYSERLLSGGECDSTEAKAARKLAKGYIAGDDNISVSDTSLVTENCEGYCVDAAVFVSKADVESVPVNKYKVYVSRDYIHSATFDIEALDEKEARTIAIRRMNDMVLPVENSIEGSDTIDILPDGKS